MTTVSQIITDAYRESNINAIGVSPSALQADEALRLLNRNIATAYGNEEGEQLNALPLGRTNITEPSGFPYYDQTPGFQWTVPPNSRLMLNLDAPLTVYMNPVPQDGERFAYTDKSNNLSTYNLTIKGNGRTINNGTQLVVNTNGANFEYLYRDDIGDWTVVNPLGLNDEMPFPMDFDDFFIIGLAMRLNPRNGPSLDPQSQSAYNNARIGFIARYKQIRPVGSELGIVRLNGSYYNRYGYALNDYNGSLFNNGMTGYPWRY